MMSLSKEWALLSRAMYGQEFIEELSKFLKNQRVETVLECGCGDGNVLQGLAKKGFRGLGIDGDSEMIQIAMEEHSHPNIAYSHLNWLDLAKVHNQYDCLMCRGNSLSYVLHWGKSNSPSSNKIRSAIKKSLDLMLSKVKSGGLLYVDCVKQEEIDEGSKDIELVYPNVYLKARIDYDLKRRIRRTYGEGVLQGERYCGGGESIFISPQELEKMVKEHKPSRVWHPNLKHEINYHVICAKKQF